MNYESLTIAQLKEYGSFRYGYYSVRSLQKKADIIQRLHELDAAREQQQQEKARLEALEAAHRLTRGTLQRQEGVEELVGSLEYPFSFLENGEYPVEVKPIPGQPLEDVGAFPSTIQEYSWIHPGENDEEPWMTLCRLTNDVYVFYKGECDYTGFDCQGAMELYAHRDPNILIQYAMSIADYDCYMRDISVKKGRDEGSN
jgi:hypothetical protein